MSSYRNIRTFINEKPSEKFKLPKEIHDRIQLEFQFEERILATDMARSILASSWNVSSAQLLDSLLLIANGRLDNIKDCFPIHDPRDILMRAQSK